MFLMLQFQLGAQVFDPNEPPLKERHFANVGIIQARSV